MSETILNTPLLNGYLVGEAVSEHHGIRWCPALAKDSDRKYIVKIITVPASQQQLDALLLAGAYTNHMSALSYFRELADGIVRETEILKKLSRLEGFVPCEGAQIAPLPDRIGYEVALVYPYRRSLVQHLSDQPITRKDALNLGLDLCASMAVCRRSGYLYVDLKPENIFVDEKKEFRIGDIGFVRLDSLKYAPLPDKYRSPYTAPELDDAFACLNTTVDVYAIGIILYGIFNNGALPQRDVPIPPPEFADEGLAEILVKACDPDPEKRWKDPIQMGQAIAAYLQSCPMDDSPVVPADEQPEQPASLANPEPPKKKAAMSASSDDISDLSFLDDMISGRNDHTGISYHELSDDTSDMLSQADALLAHATPDPVVAPEPIDIHIPAPIDLTEPEGEPPAKDEAPVENSPEDPAAAPTEDAPTEEPARGSQPSQPKKRRKSRVNAGKHLTAIVASIVILGLLVLGGHFYITRVFQQNIEHMELHGTQNMLTVALTTQTEDSLLTVICTDAYGNTTTSPVSGGIATFEGLNPQTLYRIRVVISGFHQLTGTTESDYLSPAHTNILRFEAVAGAELGSVILNFSVDGQEPENWTIICTTPGEDPRTLYFSGHMTTISGLTPGSTYTFTLSGTPGSYITGTDRVLFSVGQEILPENLTVTADASAGITVNWSGDGSTVWVVRCYNTSGYNRTVLTSDLTAAFSAVEAGQSYTVEVTAQGMPNGMSQTVTVPAA